MCCMQVNVDPNTADIQPTQLACIIACKLLVFCTCTCGEKIKLCFLAHHHQTTRLPSAVLSKLLLPPVLPPYKQPNSKGVLSMQPGEAIPPVVEQVLMHGVKMEMAKMPNATYLDLRTEGPQITYETCLGADPRLSRGGGGAPGVPKVQGFQGV